MTQAESLVDIASCLPNVAKMKMQLNLTQAMHLLAKYPFDDIIRQLQNMDNKPDAIRRSLSVFLTILKWFELDIRRGFYRPGEKQKKAPLDPQLQAKKNAFLKAHPVGSTFTGNSGKRWAVKTQDLVFCIDDKMLMELDIMMSYSGIPP